MAKKNYQPVIDDLTPIITSLIFKSAHAFIELYSFGIIIEMDYFSIFHQHDLEPVLKKHGLNWIVDPKGKKLHLQMWYPKI